MHRIPDLKEAVSSLIATPSVSSTTMALDQGNLDMVHLLANWLQPLGFEISVLPIPGRENKANLVARMGQGENPLVLAGHTDTVPLDEPLWETDPFRLTEKNDRWYGLGTCDMKSFFALVIHALEPLLTREFRHPLIILATADEESSMSGARALTAAELCHARAALIGEPTGLKAVNQHKGIMMLKARITGTSGHSSDPSLGRNALDGSALLINEIIAFRQELQQQFRNDAFPVPVPTLNLGCIHGGDNPNRICDHVEIEFDVRLLPGMNSDALMEGLSRRLTPVLARQELGCELEWLHPPVPPFDGGSNQLVRTMEQLTGQEAIPVAFATEAPFLKTLGMDTVVMGPGSIDQAHQPNEFLPLDQIDPTIDIIRQLIARYCC